MKSNQAVPDAPTRATNADTEIGQTFIFAIRPLSLRDVRKTLGGSGQSLINERLAKVVPAKALDQAINLSRLINNRMTILRPVFFLLPRQDRIGLAPLLYLLRP
jgi:hypothetical protein